MKTRGKTLRIKRAFENEIRLPKNSVNMLENKVERISLGTEQKEIEENRKKGKRHRQSISNH